VELVCCCVQSEQLMALLKGSVLPLAAELLALEEREGALLALDDADAAQELVRLRQEGRGVYGRAQQVLRGDASASTCFTCFTCFTRTKGLLALLVLKVLRGDASASTCFTCFTCFTRTRGACRARRASSGTPLAHVCSRMLTYAHVR